MSLSEKLNLTEILERKYPVKVDAFHQALVQRVSLRSPGMSGGLRDIFLSSQPEYYGRFDGQSFTIRKKKRFFVSLSNLALIEGRYFHEGESTRVIFYISSFNGIMKFFAVMLACCYLIGFLFLCFSTAFKEWGLIPFAFLAGHAVILFSIFYIILRRSVSKVFYQIDLDFEKYLRDLER